MTKLPPLTSKKLLKILQKVGFEIDHASGSHYVLYKKETRQRVVLPFHTGELPKGTAFAILKSAGISRDDLNSLR